MNPEPSEEWNVNGPAERNTFVGNTGPIVKDNQGTVNIAYEAAPLPEAIGAPNNLRRSGAVAFVGRDDSLDELHQRVQANERIAIASIRGMGGVGKTELALQYGLRHSQEYPGGLCWLRAREDVGTQLIAFARAQLDLNPPMELDLEGQIAYCWRHWRAGEVLTIFDDVQRYEDIKPFLPPSESRFKVLLTTRVQLGGAIVELPLGILARAESLELLRSLILDRRIDAEPEQAEWLCDWLGDLPLGLELVGRYLQQKTTVTLTKLCERLEAKRLESRALKKAYPGMTATAGVAAAFEVSWELLEPEAQTLAGMLSLFALAPIPWKLVENCLSDWDQEDLEDWRDGLVGLHLLQQLDTTEKEDYQLHQLLREFFSIKFLDLEDNEELAKELGKSLVVATKNISDGATITDIEAAKPIIPHLSLFIKKHHSLLPNADLIHPFLYLDWFYSQQHLYNKVEYFLLKAKDLVISRLSIKHIDTAQIFNHLGALYLNQGRHRDAESYHNKALDIRRKNVGNCHFLTAQSLNNLAELYFLQENYKKAEPLYREALQINKYHLGAEHSEFATSLNNLAKVLSAIELYEEAESFYNQALQLRKQTLGAEHPYVADTLHNLANLYANQKFYDEAEKTYKESLELTETLLGLESLDVARTLQEMGKLYLAQEKRLDECKPLLDRSLNIFQDKLGEENPEVATVLDILAEYHLQKEEYEKSEFLFLKALKIRESKLGSEDFSVAISFNNLAALYQSQDLWKRSECFYIKSLEILELDVGQGHPHTQVVWNSFSSLIKEIIESGEFDKLSKHTFTRRVIDKLK